VPLCRKLNLLGDTFAIDGSKLKAVNNRGKIFTRAKMKRRLAEVGVSIDRYLGELDNADQSAPPEDTRSLRDKTAALTDEMDRLKKFEVRMLKAPAQQLSLTDPDAHSMKSRVGGIVGYNVQTGGGCSSSSDRIARGHQRGQRSTPTDQNGEAGQGGTSDRRLNGDR
jgi:transposase